jgi:hypothetical protein
LGIPKIGKKGERPLSQIPFFTYKPLAKFDFEACQTWIIQTHPNSSESPNLVIRVTRITESVHPNNLIFSYSGDGHPNKYSVIRLFSYLGQPKKTKFGDISGSQTRNVFDATMTIASFDQIM